MPVRPKVSCDWGTVSSRSIAENGGDVFSWTLAWFCSEPVLLVEVLGLLRIQQLESGFLASEGIGGFCPSWMVREIFVHAGFDGLPLRVMSSWPTLSWLSFLCLCSVVIAVGILGVSQRDLFGTVGRLMIALFTLWFVFFLGISCWFELVEVCGLNWCFLLCFIVLCSE